MQAPRLPSIFKQRNAKAFEYKPLYYDESKERIEELKKKYANKEMVAVEESIRQRMKTEWRDQRSKQVGKSNRTLLFIIAVLLFIVYWIIKI